MEKCELGMTNWIKEIIRIIKQMDKLFYFATSFLGSFTLFILAFRTLMTIMGSI